MMRACLFPLVVGAALLGAPRPALPAEASPAEPTRPRMEAVFVLDCTGSMGGLIQGAKEKIWSIANQMATARPAPEIRIGLVGYRDRGDVFVTKIVDLTDDLDLMYRELMAFQAGGGGDGPESVNQALEEAVTRPGWSRDPETFKVIYLVGDAPPHMDYPDDAKYPATCERAVRGGIVINAIRCGGDTSTEEVFREIARRGEGAFLSIAQSGGVTAMTTPYDGELAGLARDLDATVIAYGAEAERARAEESRRAGAEVAAAAPAAALADRAEFKAKAAGGPAAGKDLVSEQEADPAALDKVAEDELSPDLRRLAKAERKALVAKKVEERRALRQRVRELSERRAAFVAAELAKRTAPADSFDAAVLGSLKDQAARKNIHIGAKP